MDDKESRILSRYTSKGARLFMVTIAICDDEKILCAELERTLTGILTQQKTKYKIDIFYSSQELCQSMGDGTHFDLIFLDIEFAKHELNGVEVGKLIRDIHQNHISSIVYISWEKKYSMQLFELRPMNFLIKPLSHAKIEHCVKTFLKVSGLLSGTFTYKKGHDIFKLPIKDIIYLENRERKVVVHLTGGRAEEFYGSLKDMFDEQLSKYDFLFIHASYAVNYDYITVVKFNQLLLTDRETPLPISPNRRNAVRQHYMEIMKKRGSN